MQLLLLIRFVSANFAFVTALIEDPTFEGTKVNCAVAGGELVLDTGEMSMEYVFNNLVDLGVVKNVKIVPDLEAKAVEASNSFCNVVDVCSLASFCGIDADAEVVLEMSVTDDDTTLDPTWSEFTPLIPGEYTARGFRFRLEVSVGDLTTIASVTKLRVEFDTENITQLGAFSTITTDDTTVTFAIPFYSGIEGTTTPNVGTQIIGGQPGDQCIISSVSNLNFTASVFNNGVRVIRTV